jgi:hypothetical protein
VARASTPRTILISIMHGNNEVGTIQPITEVTRIARARGIFIHTDTAQSVGKVPTDVNALGVDLLTIAGHKVCVPKGVGALHVRRATPIESLIHGAGHEGGRRAGTESALLVVGLGTACAGPGSRAHAQGPRPARPVLAELQAAFDNRVALNGHPDQRLPNTLNVSFVGQVGTRGARPARWRCRLHGLRLPYRPCRAVAGVEGDGRGRRLAWAPSASASGAVPRRTRSTPWPTSWRPQRCQPDKCRTSRQTRWQACPTLIGAGAPAGSARSQMPSKNSSFWSSSDRRPVCAFSMHVGHLETCCSRNRQGARTSGCSTALVMMWLPFAFSAQATPLRARVVGLAAAAREDDLVALGAKQRRHLAEGIAINLDAQRCWQTSGRSEGSASQLSSPDQLHSRRAAAR